MSPGNCAPARSIPRPQISPKKRLRTLRLAGLGALLTALAILLSFAIPTAAGAQSADQQLPERLVPNANIFTKLNDASYVAEMHGLLDWLAADTTSFWLSQAQFETSSNFIWVDRTDFFLYSACGNVRQIYAAYCPLDDTIYMGNTFTATLMEKTGDGAVAYVLAHEYAHNVQLERRPELALRHRVSVELQADCLAGAYLLDMANRGLLSRGDYREAMALARVIGDETHGTNRQRANALHRGWRQGTQSCWDRWTHGL